MSITQTIAELPTKAVAFAKQIGEIPDHVWHLSVIGLGVIMTLAHQKETGATLVTAGLAMFKGKTA